MGRRGRGVGRRRFETVEKRGWDEWADNTEPGVGQEKQRC